MHNLNKINNQVKLVIWDLDDTFWKGTLTEINIEIIEKHVKSIINLAQRGIISSIVSKNDFNKAIKIIEEIGLINYFVLPSISFEPKGERIFSLIKKLSLRPENVLFIDDNIQNLAEAQFYSKNLMIALPSEIDLILNHPHLKGNDDPYLTRLKQYKLIENKLLDLERNPHSTNEQFLVQSEIKIYFEFNLIDNFDRVIELINRTNQLNYTKIRIETESELTNFQNVLKSFGIVAGLVGCRDKYGDYGFIGFFCLMKTTASKKLLHFCFSCRTMNMGIEKYVYQHLGRPEIDIVGDVAYLLESEIDIHWIERIDLNNKGSQISRKNYRTLIIGGCELLQISSLIGGDSIEFTNGRSKRPINNVGARFDDPFFIIAPRNGFIGENNPLHELSGWNHEDLLLVDQCIANSDIILVSMVAALRHIYIQSKTEKDVFIRTRSIELQNIINTKSLWFHDNFLVKKLTLHERLSFILRCFDVLQSKSSIDAKIFVIGAEIRGIQDFRIKHAYDSYNHICLDFCNKHNSKFVFVDVNEIVKLTNKIDKFHYNRMGYIELANFICSK